MSEKHWSEIRARAHHRFHMGGMHADDCEDMCVPGLAEILREAYANGTSDIRAQLAAAQAENARMREALEWYAQEWLYDVTKFTQSEPLSLVGETPRNRDVYDNPVRLDRGARARAALSSGKAEQDGEGL